MSDFRIIPPKGVTVKGVPGYETFSGADMIVSMVFPGCAPIILGQTTTISHSTLRDKGEVRTLGRITVKGITKGGRRVAGQIIFTVFNRHIIEEIKEQVSYLASIPRLLMDELPPFDLIITCANEYGYNSFMVICGATIVHEGEVKSIEDMITENTMMFLARDIRPMGAQWGTPESSSILRNLDELLGKFKVGELQSNVEVEEWAAEKAAMQSMIDSQVNNIPEIVPTPGSAGASSTPPQTNSQPSYTTKNITLKVTVRDQGGLPITDAKVRIFVPYKKKSFPTEPNFYTTGSDGFVEYNLLSMPMTNNNNLDLVGIRVECPGYRDTRKDIHLSTAERQGLVVEPITLEEATTPSFSFKRIRPSEYTAMVPTSWKDTLGCQLLKNGKPISGVDVTWVFSLNDPAGVHDPILRGKHYAKGKTGAAGVITLDILHQLRLYALYNTPAVGQSISVACIPPSNDPPIHWMIVFKP